MGPEGGRPGRPGRPTQAVRNTCSGNLGIVKILRYIRSDMHTAVFGFWQEDAPPLANRALCLSTHKHNGKSGPEHVCDKSTTTRILNEFNPIMNCRRIVSLTRRHRRQSMANHASTYRPLVIMMSGEYQSGINDEV